MTRWLSTSTVILSLATCSNSNAIAPSPPASATLTIRADGMTPKEISINRGSRVTVVNLDSRAHRPMSDPHPDHVSCAVLNFESIAPSGQAQSAVINDALDCRLHDEMNAADASFTARVLIGLQ